jgi:bacterioferritin-associated ferredoxin
MLRGIRNIATYRLRPSFEARMYVCLCNAITDRDLRRQIGGGECSVAAVYRALGCTPRCGKCVPFVRQMLHRSDAGVAAQEAGGDD